jgi:hypothetical protein
MLRAAGAPSSLTCARVAVERIGRGAISNRQVFSVSHKFSAWPNIFEKGYLASSQFRLRIG